MVPLQYTFATRGAAREGGAPGTVKTGRIETQIERIKYLGEKAVWISAPKREEGRDASACSQLIEAMPLLDDPMKRKALIGLEYYVRAMKRIEGDDDDIAGKLAVRVRQLEKLYNTILEENEKMKGAGVSDAAKESINREIEDAFRVYERVRIGAEALVLKKRGTACVRLFLQLQDSACLCIAQKSLAGAAERWETLGGRGENYAKALYWLGLVQYVRGEDEEAAKYAGKCRELAQKNGMDWLQFEAQDIYSRAMMSANYEKMMR